jgi:hypothetical protein
LGLAVAEKAAARIKAFGRASDETKDVRPRACRVHECSRGAGRGDDVILWGAPHGEGAWSVRVSETWYRAAPTFRAPTQRRWEWEVGSSGAMP